jgi:hypothetical protein
MVGSQMNNEMGRILKEVVWPHLRYYTGISQDGLSVGTIIKSEQAKGVPATRKQAIPTAASAKLGSVTLPYPYHNPEQNPL